MKKLIQHIQQHQKNDLPLFLWVDLFCGCGGVTEGYSQVENNFIVACVNHDPYAIISHEANHPECIHFTEDIRDWTVINKINTLIQALRLEFPTAIIGLHASLECTHFSNAKGGDSRDADSRTLGDHLQKYLIFNPDYITIENVKEFLTWGELDQNGRPNKALKGLLYNQWRDNFINKGYSYQYKILNSADFGAYTDRRRYFGVFALNNLPIAFPSPTHAPIHIAQMYPSFKPYNAVKDKLDLHDVGSSLFGLTKQGKLYSDKTILRVLNGLKKQYTAFLTSYYGNGNSHSIDTPCNTITTKDRFAFHYVQYNYSKPQSSNINEPIGTITTVPKQSLVSFLYDHQFSNTGNSIERPCPTIIARQDKKPLYIATAITEGVDHSVELEQDSQARKAIKTYMRANNIKDVSIRTLYAHELLKIQGFPADYILKGGDTRAKKYIGNSVVPEQAKANAQALLQANINQYQKLKTA
jgi:DNA (cytosine-5)-methyltransferase 1